jgi:ribokinase
MNLSDSTAPRPRPCVLVVGSLNLDHIWTVPRLPGAGCTVLASSARSDFGGKGANQAVAAARQGARVVLVGPLGDDEGGRRYARHLEDQGIDLSGLLVIPEAATGAAHIYVDPNGENLIVVNSGANAQLDLTSLRTVLARVLPAADTLLVQLESPLMVVQEALRQAHKLGLRGILNASPWQPDFTWDTPVDTVIVNEHEGRDFFGLEVAGLGELTESERRALLSRYRIGHLIITRGSKPTVLLTADEELQVPAYPVTPRDTVGAGDSFAGALAVRRAEGAEWRDAIWHANVCAALSTLIDGAQASIPMRDKVERAASPVAGPMATS